MMKDVILKSELVRNLLQEYRSSWKKYESNKIQFNGQGDKDVYNISSPFEWDGNTYILGRIEARDSEISDTGFFVKTGDNEYNLTDIIIPMLQDPFYAFIDEQLFVGGTEIFLDEKKNISCWHTTIFIASDLKNFTRCFLAPSKMKDVRVFQTNKIYIFTRPQGGKAKFGRIGLEVVGNLADMYRVFLGDASIFMDQFDDLSWGGVNQIVGLKDGRLGILGHIACMSEGDVRHYYAMTFAVNPKTRERTPMKIICERSDFPEGEAKRKDLVDVIFPGGIERNSDKTATLFVGLSDAEAYSITIEDPFLEYE